MSIEKTILWIHVAAGFVALCLGPVAMSVRKRRGWHTRIGEVYHCLVLMVCVLATIIVMFDWNRLWWFVPVAFGSYALAFVGYVAAKKRWKDWLTWHVSGQAGSYIAMLTAFLVANWHTFNRMTGVQWPVFVAWALPSIIGSPIVVWVNLRISALSNHDAHRTT